MWCVHNVSAVDIVCSMCVNNYSGVVIVCDVMCLLTESAVWTL